MSSRLHSEFQDSLGYRMRRLKPKKRNKNSKLLQAGRESGQDARGPEEM